LNYKKCKPKDTFGTIDAYGNEKLPKKYSMEVSEYIYENVQSLKTKYNDKTNSVINNLLHMGIGEKFENYSFDIATAYNNITPNTKQYAIPLSSEFTFRLEDISKITGIKVNQLISLIVGNYLIEHFTDYDNNIYQTKSGQLHHSVW
jgi:predicted DNA-binding protein